MSAASGLPEGTPLAAQSLRRGAVLRLLWMRPHYRWSIGIAAAAVVCGVVLRWSDGAAWNVGTALLVYPAFLGSLLAWMAVLQTASEQGTAERLQLIPGLRRRLRITLIAAWILLSSLPSTAVLLTIPAHAFDAAVVGVAVDTWFYAAALSLAFGWLTFRPMLALLLVAAPLLGLNLFELLNPYSALQLRDDSAVSIAAWAVALLLATVASAHFWVGRPGEAQARRDRIRLAAGLLSGPSSGHDEVEPALPTWLQRVNARLHTWSDRLTATAAIAAPASTRGLRWAVGEHSRLLRASIAIAVFVVLPLLTPAAERLTLHWTTGFASLLVAACVGVGTATVALAMGALKAQREEVALWQLGALAPPRPRFDRQVLRMVLSTALAMWLVTTCGMVLSTLLWLDPLDWSRGMLTIAPLSLMPFLAMAWSPRDSERDARGIGLAVLLLSAGTAALYGVTMTHPNGWIVSVCAGGLALLALMYRTATLLRLV